MKSIRYFLAVAILISAIWWFNTPIGSAQEAQTATMFQIFTGALVIIIFIEMVKEVIQRGKERQRR